MKKHRLAAISFGLLLFASAALSGLPHRQQPDISVWKEFVAALKAGEVTSDKLRPYYEELRPSLLGYLKEIRERVNWAEMEAEPEVHRVGSQVHFLVPLSFGGPKVTYVFSFVTDKSGWYFQHLEAITIRLDRIGALPASTFPDVPEETKAHIREEMHWSREVQVFNALARAKDRELAFDFFKDGAGYFLAARVWVPYVDSSRAFILYLCWEQANLTGNEVTLEKLTDQEAAVRLKTYFFRLYKESAHLSQQIPFADYQRVFETIWQDRARAAGWDLRIEYVNKDYPAAECLFNFSKKRD